MEYIWVHRDNVFPIRHVISAFRVRVVKGWSEVLDGIPLGTCVTLIVRRLPPRPPTSWRVCARARK